MSTPQTTHWDGCATDGGPAHYECAVGRIRELEAELARVIAERDALRAALREAFCPRPANNRPEDFTVGQCCDADECGCIIGAPLMDADALSRGS